MPIYEYKCAKCGNELEVMHKVSDPNPTQCPKCHAAALERQMSRTSFQLKGGGWGSDLYASTKKGDASSTTAAAPATSSTTAPSSTTSTTTPTAAPAAPASSSSGSGTGGSSSGSGGSST